MSRHLVTGGAGFVGSALCKRLAADGHEVIAFDRFSRGKASRLEGTEVKCLRGDVRHGPSVRAAAYGVDCIWHLAYVQGTQTFYADPKDVIDVALNGIMNVLRAAQNAAPRQAPDVVLVSSSEVYQEPPEGMYPTDETVPLSVPDVTNPRYSYGGGKIASELALLAYAQAGLTGRALIVRPHNVYGPDMGWDHVIPQFAQRMIELGPYRDLDPRDFPIQGTGLETRSFCYIDDCIDALMMAHAFGGDREIYHIGNPDEEYTIAALAHLMAEGLGLKVEVVPGVLPKGSPTRRKPSIDKLRSLGFRPQWTLPQGLAPTLDWYAANPQPVAA